MRSLIRVTLMALALLMIVLLPLPGQAWERGAVTRFATLPAGAAHPEGITVDSRGNVYVTTFDVARAGLPGEVGHLLSSVPTDGCCARSRSKTRARTCSTSPSTPRPANSS